MATDDVNTNVVLTADTSQYDQAFMASAGKTDNLTSSIDTLTGKLNNLAKSAGHKMIGFSVADIASITAVTGAYAAYEKQLTSLSTQAAVMTRSQSAATQTMRTYRGEVDQLSRTFGMSTNNAVQLEQTVTRLSDNTAPITKLTKTFAMMGQATQESSTQLSASVLQLTKTMGNPQRDIDKYANQLTVLSKRANTTAASIADFAAQMAPVGRLANISQTDLQGFSTAFIKAGQDGYQAANVFNKMLGDISYATQTGSPELAKYANLVGMTTANFKDLGGTDKFLKIFEAINRQGPAAITTLNRMGLDGARTVRTVTAMAQSGGGIAAEINAARGADPEAMSRGANASMDTIVESLKRFKAEMAQLTEAVGQNFAGPAKAFIGGMTDIASVIREIAQSPLGKITAWVVGLAAPFAAVAGAVLASAAALAKFSAAAYLIKGAPMQGFMAQRGLNAAGGGTAELEGGSWTNRMFYGGGALGARVTRAGMGAGPSIASRMAGWGMAGLAKTTDVVGHSVYGPGSTYIPGIAGSGGFDNVGRRLNFFGAGTASQSFAGITGAPGAFRTALQGQMLSRGVTMFGGGFKTRDGFAMSHEDAQAMNTRMTQLQGSRTAGLTSSAEKMATAERDVQRISATAAAMGQVERTAMNASRGLTMMGRSVGNLVGLMGTVAMSAGRVGGGLARSAYGLVGGNPLMAAGLGIFGGYELGKAITNSQQANILDTSGFAGSYYSAGGIQAPPNSSYSYARPRQTATSMASAMNISHADVQYAKSGQYKIVNSQLKGLTAPQAAARLATQWPTMSKSPAAVDSVALDLTNMYGQSVAQQILSQLSAGSAPGLQTFASQAGHAGSHGLSWWLGQQSGSSTSTQWNQFFGGLKDQTAQNSVTMGSDAAQRAQGQSIQSAYAAYQKNKRPGSQVATMQELMYNLFNIKKDDLPLTSFLHPFRAGAEHQLNDSPDLKSFLRTIFSTQGSLGQNADLRKQALSQYGLNTNLTGNKAATAAYNAIVNPTPTKSDQEDQNSTSNRLIRLTQQIFGTSGVLGSKAVATALSNTNDVNAQYNAINDIVSKIQGSSNSVEDQQKQINRMLSVAGGDPNMGSDLFSGAASQLSRATQFRMPYMNRTQQFGAQSQTYSAAMATPISSGFSMEDRQNAENAYQQQVQAQYDYFKQMLYQQREFDVMRSRSEADYALQRQYAYSDFARSRDRAEHDFYLMRSRAEADFGRSMKRNQADFNLSRKRQEEDYHHSVMLMVDQQAKAMYNIYERVNVQRTSSASWLLVNSQDQLKRMQGQETDLNAVRKMGLSKDAIQQMGFTDSANAQQLARFVTEATNNPALIKSFNETVAKRLAAAKALVTDDSSQEWEEFNRSYKLSQTRAQQDFTKSMNRAQQDFTRQLHQQNTDFKTSLDRQQQDFGISMDRQAVAYKTSMDRSAADLARSAQTIDGNFEDILTKATQRLSGHAKAQAKSVLKEFETLKSSTDPAAVAIMKSLSEIFGVKYTAPKNLPQISSSQNTAPNSSQISHQNHMAAGGVLPGYTPGVDVHHFRDSAGNSLHLSGGEAIMVPEWTKAIGGPGVVQEMNRKARGHSFASGGTFTDPDRRVYMDGEPVSAITKAQLLLAEKLSHKNFTTIQGSWQPRTSYSGTSHMGPGVVDEVPGNFDTQYWMRRVAFAAWGRNFPGAATAGSGAHVHAVSRLDPGAASHPQLSSFARGEDGLGGKDYGPNPSVIPGIQALLGQFADLVLSGGSSGGGQALLPSFGQITKSLYPRVERAVAALSAVQPFMGGQMSNIINSFAHTKYNEMYKAHKNDFIMTTGGVGGGGGGGPVPSSRNQSIVHQAMRNAGWGENEWGSLYELVNHESSFNNAAKNPRSTAYGLFQFLDGTWNTVGGHKTSDPTLQSQYGMKYIKGKYGDPNNAWKFWQGHQWYGEGGVFTGPTSIGVGERGPEMVLPLNDRGTTFIAELMAKMSVGMEGRATNLTGSVPKSGGTTMSHNYQIDRSTNFTGAITVKANNPNEMISQLQSRQRVAALSQASLGGSRL